MLGLYALGIVAAIAMARLFSRFLMRGEDLPFVMELPPYRMPTVKSVCIHTWEKGRQYLQKMGGIILVFSLVIWALNYFPHPEEAISQPETTAVATTMQQTNVADNAQNVETANQAVQQANQVAEPSYLQRIGHFIAPVMSPMHFDWKMSVGIL